MIYFIAIYSSITLLCFFLLLPVAIELDDDKFTFSDIFIFQKFFNRFAKEKLNNFGRILGLILITVLSLGFSAIMLILLGAIIGFCKITMFLFKKGE